MVYRYHRLNTPALLRALADVLEKHQHSDISVTISPRAEVAPFNEELDCFNFSRPSVDVSFSARIHVGISEINFVLSEARRNYG